MGVPLLADVTQVPAKWREIVRSFGREAATRVRSFDDYPDARVERTWTGMVTGLTAYAIAVETADGAAVIPFDTVVRLEHISSSHATEEPLERHALGLPVLPGDLKEYAPSADPTKGLTAITDGAVVTHVWVTAPWSGSIGGVRIDKDVEDIISSAELQFTTDVTPKIQKPTKGQAPVANPNAQKFRELTSESIAGLRVTIQADDTGHVRLVEIARR